MESICAKSNWLFDKGMRLDASFHSSEGRKYFKRIENAKISKKTISEVTKAVFYAPRFARQYVSKIAKGVPFLSSSDILRVDISEVKYLSKKLTKNLSDLKVGRGWTLISRSGTIGNMAYCRQDMVDNAVSEHVIRVVPSSNIPSGYLYSFLSSRYGKAMVVQGAYGAVVQHIEPDHLKNLTVPLLKPKIMDEIHGLIEKSAILRSNANNLIHQSSTISSSCLPSISNKVREFETSKLLNIDFSFSFAGHNNSRRINSIKQAIVNEKGFRLSEICSNIFAPPLFKHIYLKNDNGFPFMTGGELQREKPIRYRFLSPLGVKDIREYVVENGWVVLYKSGSIDGMIGTPFLIGKELKGFCLSDHVIRIIPDEGNEDMLLWAFSFFKSRQGKMILKQLATGSAVPFILPARLKDIYIPTPKSKKELTEVASNIRKASEFKTEANKCEGTAIQLVEQELSKWLD